MFNFITTKISRKLALLSILLALVICLGCCISGYVQYRDSIYERYNDFAFEIAEIARSYVDGNRIASYLDTENNPVDEDYNRMADGIYQVYKNSSLYENKSGIYIYIPNREDTTISNLFDVRIIEAAEEIKQYYAIGCKDPIAVKHPEHVFEIYETGAKVDDYFVHETKFGYNSTANLPIYDSDNNIVAVIAADMPIPAINETLNKYLITTILITVLIVAAFMFLFVAVLKKTITKPLGVIVGEAQKFSKSDIAISDVLPNIKKKDEIGQLSSSILTMEKDIKTYVENLTTITAEKERIGAELDVATHIQASMLPCIFPAFPERKELDIFASMNPAKEVGGDFYDFFMVDEKHIAIVMADVSGKGVPAALFMVIGKTLIKDHTLTGKSLSDVFSTVNNLLCEANSEGLFITAFEGVLDLETGEFNFVNAGHEMPFIYKKSEGYKPYKVRPGFVLAGMEDMKFKAGTMQLEVGDKIFQYTDGVTEATNLSKELFGMERLEESLNQCCELTPEDTIHKVKTDVDTFVGEAEQFDDITMLCIEYKEKFVEKE